MYVSAFAVSVCVPGLEHAGTTVTGADLALSAPVQLECLGVTVYRHAPAGTEFSVQLTPETVPLQLDSTVWAWSFAS